jgi:hypothetical protein
MELLGNSTFNHSFLEKLMMVRMHDLSAVKLWKSFLKDLTTNLIEEFKSNGQNESHSKDLGRLVKLYILRELMSVHEIAPRPEKTEALTFFKEYLRYGQQPPPATLNPIERQNYVLKCARVHQDFERARRKLK